MGGPRSTDNDWVCLRGLSFIPHVEHNDWIFAKSLFKELATFVRSEGDAILSFEEHSVLFYL